MAEVAGSSGSSSGFWKWVGGIVTAVLVPVLIYYLTRPTPPPPPVVAQTEFDGFIQDARTHNLISGARLTLTLGQNSIVQSTDGSGKYSIVLPSPNADASMGEIAITASGYAPFTNSIALRPGTNYSVIPIDAVKAAAVLPPPVVGNVGAVAAVPPPTVIQKVPLQIVVARQLPPNFIKTRTASLLNH